MQTSGHNVAPSISSMTGAGMAGFGSAAASTEATPPSQALANANAASATAAAAAAALQERPKYVYGQVPEATTAAQHEANEHAAAEASNGVYSSQPQAQESYNAEAYGSYAQYAQYDAAVAAAGDAGYQDVQREYQGQQGYDASQGYYDPNAYAPAGYDQQVPQQGYYDQQAYATDYTQAQYDYSQQQQAYDQTQYAQAQYQPEAQTGYQPPHPYATSPSAAKGDAAYGGM